MKKKKFSLTYDGFEPTDLRVAGLALAELQITSNITIVKYAH